MIDQKIEIEYKNNEQLTIDDDNNNFKENNK